MTPVLDLDRSATRDRADPLGDLAGVLLARVVRGRRERGGPWGEAVLAELGQTRGWGAVRWAAGGVRAALRERRALRLERPKLVRISRRAVSVLIVGLLVAFL